MDEVGKHPFADVYRIRDELSKEYLELTPEEQRRRLNELAARLAAQYGFSISPAASQRTTESPTP